MTSKKKIEYELPAKSKVTAQIIAFFPAAEGAARTFLTL